MKRWTLRISLMLILGAVTTVGVAWWFGAFVYPFPLSAILQIERGVTRNNFPHWQVALMRMRGSTVIFHTPYKTTTPRPPQTLPADATPRQVSDWNMATRRYQANQPPMKYEPQPIIEVPYWSRAKESPSPHSQFGETHSEESHGWPMRALVCFRDFQPTDSWRWDTDPQYRRDNKPTASWRLDFGDTQGPRGFPRALPLHPILPGFFIDALFYGVLWFALFFGFGATRTARRALRTRRGRCPQCAYDLRGQRQTSPHPRPLSQGRIMRCLALVRLRE